MVAVLYHLCASCPFKWVTELTWFLTSWLKKIPWLGGVINLMVLLLVPFVQCFLGECAKEAFGTFWQLDLCQLPLDLTIFHQSLQHLEAAVAKSMVPIQQLSLGVLCCPVWALKGKQCSLDDLPLFPLVTKVRMEETWTFGIVPVWVWVAACDGSFIVVKHWIFNLTFCLLFKSWMLFIHG